MIPERLILHGFLSYQDKVEIDFSQISVACISGANGAGKSSMFDAITWALFGKARRNDDALINDNMNNARVVFEFNIEDAHYRIERTKQREKGNTLEFEVQISKNKWKPLTEAGIRFTEERIRETLRLDYDTFVNASFFLQGKADMFTVQTAGRRKEILSSILGLEVWETYRDEAARRRRDTKREVDIRQSMMEEVVKELGEEGIRRDKLKDLEELLSKSTELRENKTAQLDRARSQVVLVEAELEKSNLLVQQVDSLSVRLKDTEGLLADRRAQLAHTDELLQSSSEIKNVYASWQKVRESLAALDAVGREYNQYKLKQSAVQGTIQSTKAALEQERLSLEVQETEIDRTRKEQPKIEKNHQEWLSEISKLEADLKNQEKLEIELDDFRQKKVAKHVENDQLREKMDEIEASRVQLTQAEGADCPLCARPLSDEHKKSMLNKFNTDGKKLGDRYRVNKSDIKQFEGNITAVQKKINALKKLHPRLSTLQRKIGTLRQQMDTNQEKITQWVDTGEIRLKEVADLLDNGNAAKKSQAELQKIEKAIAELNYVPEDHERVRIEEQNMRGVDDKFHELQKAHTAQEGLHREIKEYKKQAQQLRDDFDDLKDSYHSLKQQVDELQKTLPDVTELEKELTSMLGEENDLRLRVGGAKQAVNVLKDQLKRKKVIEDEINEANKQIARLRTLEIAFGRDGVPALLIEQSLPQIETQANQILDRLSNGNMSVSFRTERDYADKKRKDKKQTLDIEIRDSAGARMYELYSGGEAFRINFAIRLALSRVLAQRSGARLQTLVIDEGFGSQDAEGRQRLVEAINQVSSDFEKILVITHLEELKDAFSSRIEVVRTSKGSSVEVIA